MHDAASTNPYDGPRFVRTPEAARLLGISPATLSRRRWAGGGPPFRALGQPGQRAVIVYEVGELFAWAIQHPRLTSTTDRNSAGDAA